MDSFIQSVNIRWADIDANFHLRHSVYYDWAATTRLDFLGQYGLTTDKLQSLHFGPILFREEAIFRKEIKLGDQVTINLLLVKAKKDFSRWSISHTIFKNGDTVSAYVNVDGAWIDTVKRKLASPPQPAIDVFSAMPRGESFEWMD